jgi:hypothetical protein
VEGKREERNIERENEKWVDETRQKKTKRNAETRERENQQKVSATEDDRLFLSLLNLVTLNSMVNVSLG